MSGLGWL